MPVRTVVPAAPVIPAVVIVVAAATAQQPTQQEEAEHEEQQHRPGAYTRCPLTRVGFVAPGEDVEHHVGSPVESLIIAPRPEARHDDLIDNALRQRVGQPVLDTVAVLDEDLAVVDRHVDKRTVVVGTAAYTPGVRDGEAAVEHAVAARRPLDDDRDLRRGRVVVGHELPLQCSLIARRDHARVVVDERPRFWRKPTRLSPGRCRQQPQRRRHPTDAKPTHN